MKEKVTKIGSKVMETKDYLTYMKDDIIRMGVIQLLLTFKKISNDTDLVE